MSNTASGNTTMNPWERQVNLAQQELRRANRVTETLKSENRQLQSRIERDRRELDNVRDDIEKQMEISRRIQNDLSSIERNQQRLDETMRETAERQAKHFAEIEEDAREMTRDLSQLREAHQRHVAEVKQTFETARREMQEGLARAEEDRRKTEARLKESIDELARKAEEERQNRQKKAANQLADAQGEIAHGTAIVQRLEKQLQPLNLEEDLQSARKHLHDAAALAARSESEAALALANVARSSAESLAHRVRERRAEMSDARVGVESRIASLERRLGPEAAAEMKDCFPLECRRVSSEAAALAARVPKRYENYRMLHIEKTEDAAVLDRLEKEVLEMDAAAATLADAIGRRVQRADDVVVVLEKIHGQATSIADSFSRPGDPKSDLVLDAVFGTTKARIRFSINGDFFLDEYGHGSASECAAAAQHVLAALKEKVHVRQSNSEGALRLHPLPTHETAKVGQ
jgi:chromosome segregation ATPase